MCKRFVSLFAFWLLMSAQVSHAEQIDKSDCIVTTFSLPLLGGEGDSPIIPIRIDGRNAAMYLSPDYDRIYVRDSKEFQFDDSFDRVQVTINGYHTEEATRIDIDRVQIADSKPGPVSAILLPDEKSQYVGDVPIVGVLGSAIFHNFEVVLDIPHRKATFFTILQNADCKGAMEYLVNPKAHSVALNDQYQIPVTIDQKRKWATLDPDFPLTVFPGDWDDLPELADGKVDKGKRSVTHYGPFLSVGHRLSISDFQIGDEKIEENSVLVQDDVRGATVGIPFFANRSVLFDFPHHHFYFMSSSSVVPEKGHNLHFNQTIYSNTDVHESKGQIR